MSKQYWLGVDGGGTHCRVRLYDEQQQVVGEAVSGSGNLRLGVDQVFAHIITASLHVVRSAGLPDDTLAQVSVGMGMAGACQPQQQAEVAAYSHPFRAVCLLTDAHTACLGAFCGQPGAILILGTGSCGLYFDGQHFHSIGGWGFPISDGGSGAMLGLRLIQQSLLAFDGMQPGTELSQRLLEQLGGHPVDAVAWMDQARPRDYAALAPLVWQAYEAGDALADSLVTQHLDDVRLLLRRLQQLGAGRCALMGGLAARTSAHLSAEFGHFLVDPQQDALYGAMLLARDGVELQGGLRT